MNVEPSASTCVSLLPAHRTLAKYALSVHDVSYAFGRKGRAFFLSCASQSTSRVSETVVSTLGKRN
jgi:hypothetical protein